MQKLIAIFFMLQVSYALPRAAEPDLSALPLRKVRPQRVVERIYSADYCVACHQLQAELVRRMPKGARIKLEFVQSLPGSVTVLPTVVYSDNTTDSGALVLNRKAAIPAELPVYELVSR